MEQVGDGLLLSATDLVGHLNCRHLTMLDRAVAEGGLERPSVWDPLLEVLWERGAQHEAAYVEHLRVQGLDIARIDGVSIDEGAVSATRAAMQAGAAVIVQAALRSDRWVGRADVLLRVDRPSDFGGWSYEPLDTKLARETKAGTVLQLCLYAELLAEAQGVWPEQAHIVAPWTDFQPQGYRIADYAAYYRRVKRALEQVLEGAHGVDAYPNPVAYCDVCRWRQRCDAQRRQDDHLSLVAGISKTQINELREHGVESAGALADLSLPLPWRPTRGARESYERIREQARIQRDGRIAGQTLYELLPVSPVCGLPRLPEPSPGDVFLDLEGDPFVGEGGLEYLFGYAFADEAGSAQYVGEWALNRAEERAAFERFVDFITARQARWPGLHIYHFAPYEPGALKRLMGRYATREEEIDRLLRGLSFVDLYAITRHAVRASVESYSLKKLEPLYGFKRATPLAEANQALAKVQACLELGDLAGLTAADQQMVESYNRDDCLSAKALRDWLEARRQELVGNGVDVPRPAVGVAEAGEHVAAWLERIAPVMARLLEGVPDDPGERTPEQQGRWLLANMLDWHRREQKAVWWEYFRLRDLTAEDLLDERAAVSGLQFVERVGGTDRAPVHRYSFPPQECQLRPEDDLNARGGIKLGKVEALSTEARWLDIKKRGDSVDLHPEAVFAHGTVRIDELREALLRLGEYVAVNGLQGTGMYQAARDLLLREPPRLGGGPVAREGEDPLAAALRLAEGLPHGVLPIQGPPGTGKTHTGARMVCRLVAAGMKIGVTANSHEVTRNFLNAVAAAAEETGVDLVCMQKPKGREADLPRLRFTTDNAAVFGALAGGACQVAGGTAWLWSRPEACEAVDVLVVDEAAQMSLANVLAISHAAPRMILLGDPQQLDQPVQGSHPDGTAVSALHHLLEGQQTVPPERGLFLAETWRLHPEICNFTSELFYEDRLRARVGLERQALLDAAPMSGSGLRFLPVLHEGNQSASPEEAERIAAVIRELLAGEPKWVTAEGEVLPLTPGDILVIAPYNAQAFELQGLPPGVRVGTVDKFQGQQAPLVIYSMTTSSHADAPRGMEFLYSLNRFNVATSRARCVCLLVASPAVLAADCRTPRQMQLVNAFCRYLELAEQLPDG